MVKKIIYLLITISVCSAQNKYFHESYELNNKYPILLSDNNFLLDSIVYSRHDTIEGFINKVYYQYDSLGYNTKTTEISYDVLNYVNNIKFYNYIYNPGHLLTEIQIENIDDVHFLKYEKYLYHYNSANNIDEEIYQRWNDTTNDYLNVKRIQRTYTKENPFEIIVSNWNNNEWVFKQKSECYYENNLLIDRKSFIWDSNQWNLRSKVRFQYNQMGQEKVYEFFYLKDTTWVLESYDLSFYINDNLISIDFYESWDGKMSLSKNEYYFYNKKNELIELQYSHFYNAEKNPWKRFLYNYDDYGNLIKEELQIRNYDYPYQWEKSSIKIYYYSQITSVDDNENQNIHFTISPNPASEFIEIGIGVHGRQQTADGRQEVNIQIYNIYGENVMKSFLPSPFGEGQGVRLDVSNFPNGIYFVAFQYDGKTIVEKMLVRR